MDLVLKNHGLQIFTPNQAELRILKTEWIVDQLYILAPIPDCACLDVWIPGPKRNLAHRSFVFSLGRYANELVQIFFLSFERNSVQLRCETFIGIVEYYSHQACCLLYYLCEINNGGSGELFRI